MAGGVGVAAVVVDEEVVGEDLLQCRPVAGVGMEHPTYQVLGGGRKMEIGSFTCVCT